jgi:hypothetical protein
MHVLRLLMRETQSLQDLGKFWNLNERKRKEKTQPWSKQGFLEFSKMIRGEKPY